MARPRSGEGPGAARARRATSPRRAARSTLAGASSSSWTKLYILQGELEQAEESFAEAERLFSEAGAVWAVARSLNMGAWVAWERGDLAKAEKRFRESIRLLKPLERPGDALREPARAGRAPDRSRTSRGGGAVRPRRSRDGRPAGRHLARDHGRVRWLRCVPRRVATMRPKRSSTRRWPPSPTRTSASIEHEVLGPFVQFLRDRGRDEEAERLEERLAELLPAAENSSARIA